MKASILAVSVLGLLLALSCAGALAGPNLVTNGDFEGGFNASNVALGWTKWHYCNPNPAPNDPPCGAPSYWQIDGVAPTPGRSQRVICGSWMGHGTDAGIVQAISVTAGKAYDFTCNASFGNIGGGDASHRRCWVGYDLTGQTTNAMAETIEWMPVPDDGAWNSFQARFTATGSTVSIWGRMRIFWPDTVAYGDFDNFVVAEAVLPNLQITEGPAASGATETSVTITWTTDAPSTSRVDYGLTAAYGSFAEDAALVTNHSITLTGLAQGRVHQYKVTSAAAGYNPVVSLNKTFTTLTAPTTGVNFGFEAKDEFGNPTIAPWVTFGVFDGVKSHLYLNAPAHSGGYMACAVAGYGTAKDMSGCLQRVYVDPGSTYVASVWIWTQNNLDDPPLVSNIGPAHNTRCRIGIDPTGGLDPAAGTVSWSDWESSQDWQPPYAQLGYKQIATMAEVPQGSNIATVFLQVNHVWALPWMWTVFDDVLFDKEIPSRTTGEAKQRSTGWLVDITNGGQGAIVTMTELVAEAGGGMYVPYCWIQDEDRSSGMKVRLESIDLAVVDSIEPGSRITVRGRTTRRDLRDFTWADAEIVADEVQVVSTDNALPVPLGVTNKSVCGGPLGIQRGAANAAGTSNTGLLVRTTGEVKEQGQDTNTGMWYFVIDDGSSVAAPGAGTGTGVKVWQTLLWGFVPNVGDYVAVTGVACLDVYDPTPTELEPRIPNASGDEVLFRSIRLNGNDAILVIPKPAN